VLNIRFLYKYLRAAHGEALLTRGTIRIGTLYSYRQAELGPAIGDEGEGKSETRQQVGSRLDIAEPENRSWVVSTLFKFSGATNVTLENMTLVVPEEDDDCFMYCMTHGFSSAAMRAFDADACVRIDNPLKFIKAIHQHLRREGIAAAATFAPCDYSGRNRNELMERIAPAFLKDPSYAYQKEVRLVLQPVTSERPLAPFLVSIPELSSLCRVRKL
jgi:hypothetical protein